MMTDWLVISCTPAWKTHHYITNDKHLEVKEDTVIIGKYIGAQFTDGD